MVYFTGPNLQEISASASPLWFSRLRYPRGSWPSPIASARALCVERGCSQPAPLSDLSTRNPGACRKVASATCRCVHVPPARSSMVVPARSTKPLTPSRGVRCAHRFGNRIRPQAKIIDHIQPCLVPSDAHGLQSTCQDFDEGQEWPAHGCGSRRKAALAVDMETYFELSKGGYCSNFGSAGSI